MEFTLLGPVGAYADGRQLDLGSPRAQSVLAVLLLNPTRPVPTTTLIDCVWDDSPPSKVRETLYGYMSQIRRSLGTANNNIQLLHRVNSYTLQVDPLRVDLHHFRHLVNQARSLAEAGDPRGAADLLRDALALWRGTPLLGLTGDWIAKIRTALDKERMAAHTERIALELDMGNGANLIPELADLTAQHPLNEQLAENLMLAHYQAGDLAAALACYQQIRQHLDDELAAIPGPRLQEIHQRILNRDPDLTAAPKPKPSHQAATPQSGNYFYADTHITGDVIAGNKIVHQSHRNETRD